MSNLLKCLTINTLQGMPGTPRQRAPSALWTQQFCAFIIWKRKKKWHLPSKWQPAKWHFPGQEIYLL